MNESEAIQSIVNESNIINIGSIIPSQLRTAFTIAEVLITLGIIGVVAAMTIPTIIQKSYEKTTVAKLKSIQSILAQAIQAATEEYGDPLGWDITKGRNSKSALVVANNLKPFLKLAYDCNLDNKSEDCIRNVHYHLLNGVQNDNFGSRTVYYKVVLLNGAAIWMRGPSESDFDIGFWIDINAHKGPNIYGIDTFMFIYNETGLHPRGYDGDGKFSYKNTCNNRSSDGFGCAYYILQNGNMNYLHTK